MSVISNTSNDTLQNASVKWHTSKCVSQMTHFKTRTMSNEYNKSMFIYTQASCATLIFMCGIHLWDRYWYVYSYTIACPRCPGHMDIAMDRNGGMRALDNHVCDEYSCVAFTCEIDVYVYSYTWHGCSYVTSICMCVPYHEWLFWVCKGLFWVCTGLFWVCTGLFWV